MNNDEHEHDFFVKAMMGVEPLAKANRHIETHQRQRSTKVSLAQKLHRQAATTVRPLKHKKGLSLELRQSVGPYESISYKRAGVKTREFRQLKLGRYQTEAVLDLHMMRVEQASQAVWNFVSESQSMGYRVVTIIHGKGLHSVSGVALLKSLCMDWLMQLPAVLAFHSAQPKDGGTGAVYVLLRRNRS